MSISGISNNASAAAGTATGTAAKTSSTGGFGDSDFMLMLLAQLKNQNPMDPMDDKDLMGQVTQLNSLNELQTISSRIEEIAKSNQATYASSLIGKTVKAEITNSSNTTGSDTTTTYKEGTVSGTELVNGSYVLHLGDDVTIPLDSVISITQG